MVDIILIPRWCDDRYCKPFRREIFADERGALVGGDFAQNCGSRERVVPVKGRARERDAHIVEILESAQACAEGCPLGAFKALRLEALGGYPRGLGLELLQHTLRLLALSAEDDRSGTGGEIDLVVKVAAEQTLGVKPGVERR